MSSNEEKEVGSSPAYQTNSSEGNKDGPVRSDKWATRNGVNLESFKVRDYGHGIVELDRSMQPRHLHMIAIGGSIGAGFFVGSGSALRTGVSTLMVQIFVIRSCVDTHISLTGARFSPNRLYNHWHYDL